jgi:uncharacterized SAM-binding protein YcdF (DUF218 family)
MPKNSKRNRKKIIITLVIIIFFLFLFLWFLLPRLGQWLVVSDPLMDSDIIVVLMGSTYDRILQAADLHHEGYVDKIIIVESYVEARELAEKRGVQIYGNALISKMTAMDLGIPEKDIITIEGSARSTQDEARAIRNYLEEDQSINRIILVTSKSHSARSKKIFQKVFQTLDREILTSVVPSSYDSFSADNWWMERESFKQVVLEYLKLINFYLREQYLLD